MDRRGRICEFVKTDLLVDQGTRVTDDTPLLEGILDSLGLMSLVAFLEEEFDVAVDDGDIVAANFATVADIDALLERRALERR